MTDIADTGSSRTRPAFTLLLGSDDQLAGWLADAKRTSPFVAQVDGGQAQTEPAFFAELAEAMSFPDYFGKNWDAVDEMLGDLSWLEGSDFVLVIDHSLELLSDEPQERLKICVNVLTREHAYWAGGGADREARPRNGSFVTVLHATPDQEAVVRARYSAVGVDLSEG